MLGQPFHAQRAPFFLSETAKDLLMQPTRVFLLCIPILLVAAGVVWRMGGAASDLPDALLGPSQTPAAVAENSGGASLAPLFLDEGRESDLSGEDGPLVNAHNEAEFVASHRAAFFGGWLTEKEVGPRYKGIIRGLAKERTLISAERSIQSRAARFCGFGSWDALTDAIESEEPGWRELGPQLEQLATKALSAAESVHRHISVCWDMNRGIEEWQVGTEHDSKAWRAEQGHDQGRGLMRFTTFLRVGATRFQLHFDSAEFPELEVELKALLDSKNTFWEGADAIVTISDKARWDRWRF